ARNLLLEITDSEPLAHLTSLSVKECDLTESDLTALAKASLNDGTNSHMHLQTLHIDERYEEAFLKALSAESTETGLAVSLRRLNDIDIHAVLGLEHLQPVLEEQQKALKEMKIKWDKEREAHEEAENEWKTRAYGKNWKDEEARFQALLKQVE